MKLRWSVKVKNALWPSRNKKPAVVARGGQAGLPAPDHQKEENMSITHVEATITKNS